LLVGGFKHDFYFSIRYGNVIIPSDALIFFKMVKTTNQLVKSSALVLAEDLEIFATVVTSLQLHTSFTP